MRIPPTRPRHERIPRLVHWCWFGRNPLPDLTLRCLESWRRNLPEYEIVLWNEDNFDVTANRYAREAYNAKKWAFVADYARVHALFKHGGIYLDADVEVRRNLDPFLVHGAFSGFESACYPVTATWGAAPSHPWLEAAMEHYGKAQFSGPEGLNLTTNTVTMSDILVRHFGIQPLFDTFQMGKADVAIYPSTTFCMDTPASFTVHHFAGTWSAGPRQHEPNGPAQLAMRAKALEDQLAAIQGSTSWRMTAPLRGLGSLLGRMRRRP